MENTNERLLTSIVLALSVVVGGAQSSITVNFSAPPTDRDVLYNAGLAVPDGNYVQVGYFNAGFDVAANALNFSALSAAWDELGFTNIASVFGQPHCFAGPAS